MRKFFALILFFFFSSGAIADPILVIPDGEGKWTTGALRTAYNTSITEQWNKWLALGAAYDTAAELDALFGGKQDADPFLADIAALVDPNADRLLFWDDSAGVVTVLALGAGLSIDGTILNSTGGGVTVDDTVYGISWDGDTTAAPTKNAIYDKIETMSVGSGNPTSLGIGASDVSFGIFTGTLLPDNQTAKQLFQAIETELEDTVSVNTNGFLVRTGPGEAVSRTIIGGTGITAAYGDGVAGDPVVALADTAVTPGTYTNANITVDAQGRVTSAGNGSAGGVSAYESGTECDFYGTILNPQGVYDNDATNHAVTIAVNVPAAFTITAIYVSCDADPTTEPTLTFQHKATGVGYSMPTTIEAVTTAAGVASITSGIDSATISPGSKIFVTLSDPDDALVEISWQLKGVYN